MSSETENVIAAALQQAACESRREIDRHVEYERERFEQTVAALAGVAPAVADISALAQKPTYAQVGTLQVEDADGSYAVRPPFDWLQAQGRQIPLVRGYVSAIHQIAWSLSEHKDGPLPSGRYRYAIMLFREDEPKQGG